MLLIQSGGQQEAEGGEQLLQGPGGQDEEGCFWGKQSVGRTQENK